MPSAGQLSESLRSGIDLLTAADDLTLEELLEARELLEVPAARLAARRRTDEDLLMLDAAIPDRPLHLPMQEQFVYNRDFHSCVIAACGNTLLSIAAQPVFAVLQTLVLTGLIYGFAYWADTLQRRYASERARREELERVVAICAWTGRVRWNGEWVRIEQFLSQRFGIQVSHTISDEALEQLEREGDPGDPA